MNINNEIKTMEANIKSMQIELTKLKQKATVNDTPLTPGMMFYDTAEKRFYMVARVDESTLYIICLQNGRPWDAVNYSNANTVNDILKTDKAFVYIPVNVSDILMYNFLHVTLKGRGLL